MNTHEPDPFDDAKKPAELLAIEEKGQDGEPSLVSVLHIGNGDAESGKILAEKMATDVLAEVANGREVVVYHNARMMPGANEAYARAFAQVFLRLKPTNVRYVALVPKSYLRILARVASKLANIDMHMVRTEADALHALQELGIRSEA